MYIYIIQMKSFLVRFLTREQLHDIGHITACRGMVWQAVAWRAKTWHDMPWHPVRCRPVLGRCRVTVLVQKDYYSKSDKQKP